MTLKPVVQKVTEGTAIGADRRLQKTVVISYTVGDHGPFTLVTTQADLQNGAAATAMQTFANSLATIVQ